MQTVLIVENFRIRCMAIKDPSKLLWPAAKKCQCTTVGLLCLCFTQMFARQLWRVELFCTRQFSRDSVARNIVKSLKWSVSSFPKLVSSYIHEKNIKASGYPHWQAILEVQGLTFGPQDVCFLVEFPVFGLRSGWHDSASQRGLDFL